MGIKNRLHSGYVYYLTLTVTNRVDVFTRPVYRHMLLEAIKNCQREKSLEVYAWCLMSDHLQIIASAKDENYLMAVLRDLKKASGKAILKALQEEPESGREWLLDKFAIETSDPEIKNYKFWQDGNSAKEIHTIGYLEKKLDLIHQNPVQAEIVKQPDHYLYSSAIDYAGGKGLLEVILVD